MSLKSSPPRNRLTFLRGRRVRTPGRRLIPSRLEFLVPASGVGSFAFGGRSVVARGPHLDTFRTRYKGTSLTRKFLMGEVPLHGSDSPRAPAASTLVGGYAGPQTCRGSEQLRYSNAQRFRGGLECKAHGRLYHSTLGLRVIKKKKRSVDGRERGGSRRKRTPP